MRLEPQASRDFLFATVFSFSMVCFLVQMSPFDGKHILGPKLFDMDQRALPRAKDQMLQCRDGQELVFAIHLIKLDVSGVHVSDIDSVCFQVAKDLFDFGPVLFESHGLHLFPVAPDFERVVGRSVEVSATKVKAKRRADNGHFDGE